MMFLETVPPTIRIYNSLGNAYLKLKRFKQAIENFDIAMEMDPNYALTYNYLGDAYLLQDKFEKATDYYYKAVKIKS